MTTFESMGLHKQVVKAVTDTGYDTPTPIQTDAIPLILAGRDVLGIAQTGTGKTAAFALPTLHHLTRLSKARQAKCPRALVLAPTRELALQISTNFRNYSANMHFSVQTVIGGAKIGRQIRDLEKGCDVLVATPGRLVDLMDQKAVSLSEIEIIVLDEADHMLDLGFIKDLNRIVASLPKDRQTLLFSATMPKSIAALADTYLNDPAKVSVAPESSTAERVRQGVLHVEHGDKLQVLSAYLKEQTVNRALIFVRTKRNADNVVRKLHGKGFEAQSIHGDKSQSQRARALRAFREGKCQILVATDIAARGIDVDGVSHVVNYDLPDVAEQYVHRIGRTARAGADGEALTLVSDGDLYYLREIERAIQIPIALATPPSGFEDAILPEPDPSVRAPKPERKRGGTPPRSGKKPGGPRRRSNPQAKNSSGAKTGSKPPQKSRRTKPKRRKPAMA